MIDYFIQLTLDSGFDFNRNPVISLHGDSTWRSGINKYLTTKTYLVETV